MAPKIDLIHGDCMDFMRDFGFDITCIEKDKDYFEAAKQRIENHKKQPPLLATPLTPPKQEALL